MKKQVLDHGYILTLDTLGSDLTIVNSARVSFDKSVPSLGRRDYSLIDYLISHRHDSVLRHCAMSFEIYAPLFVARQWWKHHVGATAVDDQNGWNESSRRYVTEEPQFYVPASWRAAADNKKQGSGGDVQEDISSKYSEALQAYIDAGNILYDQAMEDGLATELARLFLPSYGMYVRWRWTASLNALLNFIDLRRHEGAQWEIQQYADILAGEVKNAFPITYTSWEKLRVR